MFKNHQWGVTNLGLETVRPATPVDYFIEAKRLLEDKGEGQGRLYDWPLHMAEKNWVDIEAFMEAFEAAIKEHAGKYPGHADPERLKESNEAARARARRFFGD